MQVPSLVTSHFAPAEAYVIESTAGAYGGSGGDDGGDGGDVGDGGGDGGAGDAQITKPPAVVILSLDHAIVSPAAITTLLGPLVPEYRLPPMVM